MRPPSDNPIKSLAMSLLTKSLIAAPLALLLTSGDASAQRGGGVPGGGRVSASVGGRPAGPVGGMSGGFRGAVAAPRPPVAGGYRPPVAGGYRPPVAPYRPTYPGAYSRSYYAPPVYHSPYRSPYS